MSDKFDTQSPIGTRDILADKYILYQNILDKLEEIASYYGFKPIQTPVLENPSLLSVSMGSTIDTAEKEIYLVEDKEKEERIALRPEATTSVMRAYLEHGMYDLPQPVMLWYKGSFFRRANNEKYNFREFQQFGLEIIGEPKPIGEAVIMQIITLAIKELGVNSPVVHINSMGDKECRGEYKKKLINYYRKNLGCACKECKKIFKTNPLKLLDCKDPGCADIKINAPQTVDSLCAPCKQHFREILEFLDTNGINYILDTNLVLDFDYYSRTVFEIRAGDKENGESLTIALGGRYDYLAKAFGKRDAPGVGGALLVDKLAMTMQEKNIAARQKRIPKVFLIQLSSAAKQKSLGIIEMFRTANIYIAQSVSKDNLNSQLGIASRLNVPYVLIIGQKESLENSIIIRDMESGSQESVPIAKVVEMVKKKLKKA